MQHVLGNKLDAESVLFDLLLNLCFIVQSEATYRGFHLLDANSPLTLQRCATSWGPLSPRSKFLGKESNRVQLGSRAYLQSNQLWPGVNRAHHVNEASLSVNLWVTSGSTLNWPLHLWGPMQNENTGLPC